MTTAAAGPEGARARSLWRHRDFMLLWSGSLVSEMGSAVTDLAVPLLAVVALRASTFQVGLLTAAGSVAFLLVALPAGVIVTRRPKRRLMLGADLARAVILGSVPLAAWLWHVARATLAVAVLGNWLAVLWFVASPLTRGRDIPLHAAYGEGG